MLDTRRLKQSYVGIVSIYDLKSKKVLLQGGGYFDVENHKLDVLFDCSEVYKDVEWVPILRTEEGYFCPAQTSKGHLIGGVFSYDHRSKFSMSSYFHWKSNKGIDHITSVFNSVTIEVGGLNGLRPFPKHTKSWKSVEVTMKGVYGEIEETKTSGLTVNAEATCTAGDTVSQRVRFKITPKIAELTRSNCISLVHAFRLYWLFQHDRTNCETFGIIFGDSLNLITDLMQLPGFDDGTGLVESGLQVKAAMNTKLLAQTTNFFLHQTKTHGGVEFAFYRLLGYRFGSSTKRIGDDLLDLVFALDGFCADINKDTLRRLSKAEKEEVRQSIRKILESIEQAKDELDARVYEFYNKPEEKIFENITHKPYRESVQQCFETLNMDYAEHEDIIIAVDKVRQVFVHGKGYDTDDLVKKIYTHGTMTINESSDGKETQIVFGQTTGLAEKYYKMIRLLFLHYFQKNDSEMSPNRGGKNGAA